MVGGVGGCQILPLAGAGVILMTVRRSFARRHADLVAPSVEAQRLTCSIWASASSTRGRGCRNPWSGGVDNLHGGSCGTHYGSVMEATFRSWGWEAATPASMGGG
jgi:hypothetical protein